MTRTTEGNYQDYEVDRHRCLGTEADQLHRLKYKPIAGVTQIFDSI